MNSELTKILEVPTVSCCLGCKYYSGIYCDKPCSQLCTKQVKVLQKAIEDAGLLKPENLPKIVCICGSTRFTPLMMMMEWEYAKQGILAFGWFVKPTRTDEPTDHLAEHENVKEIFDELHKRKIDLADEVLILNVGGYIGDSTRSELAYARSKGKPIRWLEPDKAIDNPVF
jgi:hypothetical protein